MVHAISDRRLAYHLSLHIILYCAHHEMQSDKINDNEMVVKTQIVSHPSYTIIGS